MSDPIKGVGSIADQVAALGGGGRGGGTRKLAEARAAKSGKSVRTEMRAIQRAVKSGRPPTKQAPEVAKAGADRARAEKIRKATRIQVGKVKVVYTTAKGKQAEGSRNLGTIEISGDLADAMRAAADAIEAGDDTGGLDRLGEALLDEYGGLGGTLNVDEFTDGLEFI